MDEIRGNERYRNKRINFDYIEYIKQMHDFTNSPGERYRRSWESFIDIMANILVIFLYSLSFYLIISGVNK